jgi:SAM-dependent methyltransferase
MGWYERVVFRRGMEWVLDRPPIHAERASVLAVVRGSVLEVGIGTGLNIPNYPAHVERITAVSLDSELDPRAAERMRARRLHIDLVTGDAHELPIADHVFDSVVCTFLLCSVRDPAKVVREFRRVLRPGGRLALLEHVLMPGQAARVVQQVMNPMSLLVSCGCSLVRDTASTIAAEGFMTSEIEALALDAMLWPHRWILRGMATAPA